MTQGWKARIAQLLGNIDALADSIRERVRRLSGLDGSLRVLPYLGYGTAQTLFLTGRVLEDEGSAPAHDSATAWDNLMNFYKRLESDAVPGARLRVRFHEQEHETVTDAAGVFRVALPVTTSLPAHLWHDIAVELLAPQPREERRVQASGQVLVPPPSARFGVISDIDDTVLWTNVQNRLRMLLTVTLLNARTRLPFKGVAALYRALQHGVSGQAGNPIFYVSNSPWPLYEPLVEFLGLHEIPLGPLFLRELHPRTFLSPTVKRAHKLNAITQLLELYTPLPFVLIGDSGEQDPEIYRQVVQQYPDRIRVIYIRSVDPNPARIMEIDRLIDEVRPTGCQLVLVPDSEFAAVHAAGEGLIATTAVAAVRAAKPMEAPRLGPEDLLEDM